jgi:putative ABC transport system permease protein
MLRNYFLTAWRNLLKNKVNALINVIGLAVAFTCCILLFLTVQFEFSYDRWHTAIGRLYQAYDLAHK